MKAFYENRKHIENAGFSASYVDNLSFVAHWHDEVELLYVVSGEVGVGLNKDFRILKKGDLSICSSNNIHYYSSDKMESKTAMIIFKPERLALDGLGIKNINLTSFYIDCSEDEHDLEIITNIMKEIVEENQKKRPHYKQFTCLRIMELILLLFRANPMYYSMCVNEKTRAADLTIVPIQKALKYIEENYMQEVSLEGIANKAGLSPYYFSRLFKKTTGTNYNSYLNQTRIERAEHLIRTTNEHIIDIAYKTGFKSIRTFNRVYKDMRGFTPQSIRK